MAGVTTGAVVDQLRKAAEVGQAVTEAARKAAAEAKGPTTPTAPAKGGK